MGVGVDIVEIITNLIQNTIVVRKGGFFVFSFSFGSLNSEYDVKHKMSLTKLQGDQTSFDHFWS